MNESIGIIKWISDTLTADATITSLVSDRVYSDMAKELSVFPLILIFENTLDDVNSVNGSRGASTGKYAVQSIGKGDGVGALQSIAERIDALLHKKSGSITGLTIVESVREGVIRRVETVNDTRFFYLGGIYRVSAY